ncbi:MAG: cytochrome b/b6 domain-containing protein [Desulfitobacterium sp.]|nr:cytochrome b/b6 domain-containing protein [Desulfitobacterium sp.]
MAMTNNKNNKSKVLRQSLVNRFVHWTTALSIFLLILTGFGQMPLYNRYNVTKLPGAEWLGDYFSTIHLHYIAAVLLIFVVTYHLANAIIRREFDIFPRRGDLRESFLIIKAMLTKGEEPPSDKYLAEQRLAYLFIGGNVLLLIGTGVIKMYKNLPEVELSNSFLFAVTMLHNLGTVLLILGIVAHLAAFIIKANRPLIPGIFTGYIDEEYAKNRHSLWYRKLEEKGKDSRAKISGESQSSVLKQ